MDEEPCPAKELAHFHVLVHVVEYHAVDTSIEAKHSVVTPCVEPYPHHPKRRDGVDPPVRKELKEQPCGDVESLHGVVQAKVEKDRAGLFICPPLGLEVSDCTPDLIPGWWCEASAGALGGERLFAYVRCLLMSKAASAAALATLIFGQR